MLAANRRTLALRFAKIQGRLFDDAKLGKLVGDHADCFLFFLDHLLVKAKQTPEVNGYNHIVEVCHKFFKPLDDLLFVAQAR